MRWPSPVPTRTTSDPMWAAIRRVSGSVRTSAVPRPLSPARGFSMQLSASFDQRSPHRFVVTTAEVRTEPLTRRIAAHIGSEVVRVGTALGHRMEPILGIAANRFAEAEDGAAIEVLGKEIAADAGSRSGGRPSMLQDVMKGRRTEIDHLNGFVAAEGGRAGIPTPFNDAVVEAVHRHTVGALTPAPGHLDPLVRLLG